MKIFSIFRSVHIEPFWTYSSEGVLWRILFSPHQRIIVEIRDQERKQASFSCLDEETGLPLWQNLQLGEKWWVGLETIHDRYAILHEFPKPDMPEHRGIWVVDVETGSLLWERRELTFWFAFQNRLYAYEQRFDKRVGYVLEMASGATLELYEEGLESLLAVRQLAMHTEEPEETFFPLRAEISSPRPALDGIIRKEIQGEAVVGSVEFLQHRNLLILNYHSAMKESSPEAPLLKSRLKILDLRRGSRIYDDILFEGGNAPVPDSFFVRHNSVYFVRNQHTLVSLRPWTL
jgi:hypothetical protein